MANNVYDTGAEEGSSSSIISTSTKKSTRGGKRPGTGGSKSIFAGGKRRFDPNTGWPTCYGDKCDATAKKISIHTTEEGGYDLAPVCHDCAKKGEAKGMITKPLTAATYEAFKRHDEQGFVPGSIHGERKRIVEEPSGRKRVREVTKFTSTSPQTRMAALEARIREADPSGPTGTSVYIPKKTSSPVLTGPDTKMGPEGGEKPSGWYTAKERQTPIVGADPRIITRQRFRNSQAGPLQQLYTERHLENLKRRRTPEQAAGLLSNFLDWTSTKSLEKTNKKNKK
jgi:hypothetical protein